MVRRRRMKNIWWGQTFSLQAYQNILSGKHKWFDAALSYFFPQFCNVKRVMFQHLIYIFSLFFFFVVSSFPIFSLSSVYLFFYVFIYFSIFCVCLVSTFVLSFFVYWFIIIEKNYKISIFIKYLIDRISNILLKK